MSFVGILLTSEQFHLGFGQVGCELLFIDSQEVDRVFQRGDLGFVVFDEILELDLPVFDTAGVFFESLFCELELDPEFTEFHGHFCVRF